MLTRKPWGEINKHGLDRLMDNGNEQERNLVRRYAVQYSKEISYLLTQIPRPMLLLLKMGDCLRSVDYRLGTPTNTSVIMARYCHQAIVEDKRKHGLSIWEKIKLYVRTVHLEMLLFSYRLSIWCFGVLDTLGDWVYLISCLPNNLSVTRAAISTPLSNQS